MELALPHVVVRICGPGVGTDLVAALSLHPLEVSEARDASEARRVAAERPTILVVVTDPPDVRAATADTWNEFPRTPILIVAGPAAASELKQPAFMTESLGKGWVDLVPGTLSLADICWHVLEAVSRAAQLRSLSDHPMGPVLIDIDNAGRVVSDRDTGDGLLIDGRRIQAGGLLLDVVVPADRQAFVQLLEQLQTGEVRSCPLRIVDAHQGSHTASAVVRRLAADRCAILLQPLISGGSIVGRHINNRDPITGLLTRWAMSRALESLARSEPLGVGSVILVMKLENFAAISEYLGHAATDMALVRVASALLRILPHPAICSRVMGDTFYACLPDASIDESARAAERLIQDINAIDMPGFSAGFQLRATVGITKVARHDYDIAIRLAEAAAVEARGAGGNRVTVAPVPFTNASARDLSAAIDFGSWEVWLQPVMRHAGNRAEFHEALARFGNGHGQVVSRPDFFVAGRAQGLLERFDRMMLQRVLEILATHPDARISVNVSFETFMSEAFPASFLDPLQAVADGCKRVILEIPPHCLAIPPASVRTRLEPLARAGVAIAADDFGSGICRLQHLTQYPLAMVKLDELVTGYVDDDPLQREFVRTVVNLCRARGIITIAEYTRSAEQWQRLVADGVDLFQGELLAMPAPATEVLAPRPVGEDVTAATVAR